MEAPHLDTKSLSLKLDDVAKTVDFDVVTSLADHFKDPVLGTVRSWLRRGTLRESKSVEIQRPKGYLRIYQEFNRLLIEKAGEVPCYTEPSDKVEDENLRMCSPLVLFPAHFKHGNYNEMAGYMGASKNYKMRNDSTISLVCLIGFVHLLVIVSHARITN